MEDDVWSAPLFFRVSGLAEGLPAGASVVQTALLLTGEDIGDVWIKDQVHLTSLCTSLLLEAALAPSEDTQPVTCLAQ